MFRAVILFLILLPFNSMLLGQSSASAIASATIVTPVGTEWIGEPEYPSIIFEKSIQPKEGLKSTVWNESILNGKMFNQVAFVRLAHNNHAYNILPAEDDPEIRTHRKAIFAETFFLPISENVTLHSNSSVISLNVAIDIPAADSISTKHSIVINFAFE